MMKRFSLAAAALLILSACGSSHASSYTYNLNTTINGDTASGVPSATIEDTGLNMVRITMSLVGTPAAQFIDTWLFNFNGTQTDLNNLTFTYSGTSTGHSADTIGKAVDGFGNNNTPGFGNNSSGLMDISFNFPSAQANRFNGGEVVVYDVTTSGASLSASLFNVTSAPTFDANGPYYTAAHVQGIPGAQSGAMGANTFTAVPEPSSVVLGLIGAAGLGVLGFRRRPTVA